MRLRQLSKRGVDGLFGLLFTVPFLANQVLAAPTSNHIDQYDYIVVGSGPGGGPLAANLARANYTVLLIEAGDASEARNAITWDFFVKHYDEDSKTRMNNKVTWMTKEGRYWVGKGSDTPPEGSKYLGIYYPRGASLGGSSMINAMVTLLPPARDWNHYVNITGDVSWSADNMRKIFAKIEHNNYLSPGARGHGFDGFLQTMMEKATVLGQPVASVMEAEMASLSQDTSQLIGSLNTDSNIMDENRDKDEGFSGLVRHTFKDGRRFSSRHYVQDTVKAGFPLTVSMNSLAARILWANSTKTGCKPTAAGIEFLQGKSLYKADPRRNPTTKGELKQATAKHEVIISAGAFNTPQLLKLSGVGPAAELAQFAIPLVVDLPGVGTNLMDNQEMPIVGLGNASAPRTNSGAVSESGALLWRTAHSPSEDRDVFIIQGAGRVLRGFWPDNQTNAALETDPANAYGISIVKGFPQNRAGYVKLRSADPTDMPEINLRLFEEGRETDMGAMKDVISWARKVHTKVAGPYGPIKSIEPPCSEGKMDKNLSCGAEDEQWIMGQTFGHHPSSTARIGADGDKMAVLDSKFRVRGTKNLRVVDASAFPRTMGVFPVVSAFIISQKATDTILAELAIPPTADTC